MNAGHSWQFKAQQQLKVQVMEAHRNYFHNGILVVRSARALEQMKGVTRDGDAIGAEGRNRDDHVYAQAMAVRYWEDRFRRGMIAGNRTRSAERAKLSISVEDQWALWNRNTLADFFKRKEADQLRVTRQMQTAAWRRAARPAQRRW
jgi:hypothetical protein